MTQPPFQLVGSGRRLPNAGPGRQFGEAPFANPGHAALIVIALAALLMVGPDAVAVLAAAFGGAIGGLSIPSTFPFHLVAILESAPVLLPFALAGSVIQANELE